MRIPRLLSRNPVITVVLLCFLSRLPQLLSPDLYCDGDECVVAMMAEKMYEGKGIPLYFWGQRYGFSLFECMSIVPFYVLFGYKTIAVKLGILSLWAVGTVFLFKIVSKLMNDRLYPSLLMITGFILFPAWMVHSMKALGGYVTSYTLSNLILYLLFCRNYYSKLWFHVLVGILFSLVFESQRLWLVGILPIWIYKMNEQKQGRRTLLSFMSMFAMCLLLECYKQNIHETYWVRMNIPTTADMFLYRLKHFQEYLYGSLHANYFFSTYQSPNFFNAVLAIVGCVLFSGIFLYAMLYVACSERYEGEIPAVVFFMPCVMVYSTFTEFSEGRYLLPVSGYMVIALAVFFRRLRSSRMYTIAVYVYLLVGSVSTICFFSFTDVSENHRKDVYAIIRYLNKKQINYVYSEDCMLPYELMFYSGNCIFARMPYQPARYQPASDSVDIALKKRYKVAVVNYNDESGGVQNGSGKKFKDFCVSENMPLPLVAKVFEVK